MTARDLLPLLLGHANRAAFLGHRPTPRRTPALPEAPEPVIVTDAGEQA